MSDRDADRHSKERNVEVTTDAAEVASIEVANGLRQFDEIIALLERWLDGRSSTLKVSSILDLNRIALAGIHENAGGYRTGGIDISGSGHTPPDPAEVPRLMEEFCDYVNGRWDRSTPVHLAAYCMWRLNWIHPFSDGNGRTSRAVSYLVLCAKLGTRLPGRETIPEQIVGNKVPYYKALEAADKAYNAGSVDVSEMEALLDRYLSKQLVGLREHAIGPADGNREAREGRIGGLVRHIEGHPVLYTAGATLLVGLLAIALA